MSSFQIQSQRNVYVSLNIPPTPLPPPQSICRFHDPRKRVWKLDARDARTRVQQVAHKACTSVYQERKSAFELTDGCGVVRLNARRLLRRYNWGAYFVAFFGGSCKSHLVRWRWIFFQLSIIQVYCAIFSKILHSKISEWNDVIIAVCRIVLCSQRIKILISRKKIIDLRKSIFLIQEIFSKY